MVGVDRLGTPDRAEFLIALGGSLVLEDDFGAAAEIFESAIEIALGARLGVRTRQISNSDRVIVTASGPRMTPDAPNTTSPPTTDTNAGTVWSRRRFPTSIGYNTLSMPPTTTLPHTLKISAFPRADDGAIERGVDGVSGAAGEEIERQHKRDRLRDRATHERRARIH